MKGGLINFPLFLLEGHAILPMTTKAGCASISQCYIHSECAVAVTVDVAVVVDEV